MTLEECYIQMGGDYQGTLRRLCSERLMQRVILKFPGDPSYGELSRAMKEGQWEDAFRAAHTLKGVSQNLGMTALYEPTAELTELLRRRELLIEKRTKRKQLAEVDIAPMIRDISFTQGENVLRAAVTVQAQNPGLNPELIRAAFCAAYPQFEPDFVTFHRREVLDGEGRPFR